MSRLKGEEKVLWEKKRYTKEREKTNTKGR